MLLVFSHLHGAGDPLIESIFGKEGAVLDAFLIESSNANYEELPKILSKELLAIQPAEPLIELLKSENWKIQKYVILSKYSFNEAVSFVVDFTVTTGGRRYHSTDVVFLIETETGWKLWNFPFAPSLARNFPTATLSLTANK